MLRPIEEAQYAHDESDRWRCVAIEARLHDQAGCHGIGSDAASFEPPRESPGEHSITGLGLRIRFSPFIGPAFELEVGEIKITREGRCHVDDACRRTRPKEVEQFSRQDVVAEHVGGKSEFYAVNAGLPLGPIDASIIDEHVEAGISVRGTAAQIRVWTVDWKYQCA